MKFQAITLSPKANLPEIERIHCINLIAKQAKYFSLTPPNDDINFVQFCGSISDDEFIGEEIKNFALLCLYFQCKPELNVEVEYKTPINYNV